MQIDPKQVEKYRQEAINVGIVSFFRQYDYINARLAGKSPEEAKRIAAEVEKQT